MEKNVDGHFAEPRGMIEKMYQEWCINHPKVMSEFFDNVHGIESVKELLLQFVQCFHKESPDFFNDLIDKHELLSKKSDEASVAFREQGNRCYQNKQFKVNTRRF